MRHHLHITNMKESDFWSQFGNSQGEPEGPRWATGWTLGISGRVKRTKFARSVVHLCALLLRNYSSIVKAGLERLLRALPMCSVLVLNLRSCCIFLTLSTGAFAEASWTVPAAQRLPGGSPTLFITSSLYLLKSYPFFQVKSVLRKLNLNASNSLYQCFPVNSEN